MSLQKFRTFEQARRALWLPSGDPRILETMQRLAEFRGAGTCVRGVVRFRTIEEANAGRSSLHARAPRTLVNAQATRNQR